MARVSKKKPIKPGIGIYCEGESEEQYFKMLKQKYHATNVQTAKLEIKAMSKSGEALINAAVQQAKVAKRQLTQIYVVFDRDDKTDAEIRHCQKLAAKKGIKILFSSVCFEIWILMHFQVISRPYEKQELFKLLSGRKYFNQPYVKFKGTAYNDYLWDRVGMAVAHADQLSIEQTRMDHDNPYTNLHDGVKQIFKQTVY